MTTTNTPNDPAGWALAPTAMRDAEAYRLRMRGDALEAIRVALGYGAGTGTVSRAIRRQQRRLAGQPVAAPIGRAFGVEIEVKGLDARQAAAALVRAGISAQAEGYNHRTPTNWKVTTDGSLSGTSCEVVSPILRGEAGYEAVRNVMAALRAAGARIDRQCGLHVHHEVIDLTGAELGALVTMFASLQPAMDRMVAPSRRGASAGWCRPLAPFEVTDFVGRFAGIGDGNKIAAARQRGIGGRPDSRYRTLNVHSFGNYGTVEFRQHQGTLNGTKAVAWIKLGQAMIEAAAHADTVRVATMLADLTDAGRLDATTAEYLAARQDALTN